MREVCRLSLLFCKLTRKQINRKKKKWNSLNEIVYDKQKTQKKLWVKCHIEEIKIKMCCSIQAFKDPHKDFEMITKIVIV